MIVGTFSDTKTYKCTLSFSRMHQRSAGQTREESHLAIYHLRCKVVGREIKNPRPGGNLRKSAVAAAAYRSGERLYDNMMGKWHTRASDPNHSIEHKTILAPEDAPDWALDRQQLWNMVERREVNLTDGKLKDKAQLFREVEITLPRELSREERIELVESFVEDQFVCEGMIADIAIHNRRASDGREQPHAHIMLTMRRLETDEGKLGDGRVFGFKAREWNTPDPLYKTLATVKQQAGQLQHDIAEFGDQGRVETALKAARAALKALKEDLGDRALDELGKTERKDLRRVENHVAALVGAHKNLGAGARLGDALDDCKERLDTLKQDMPIMRWRQAWEDAANDALERAGEPARIDCRTLRAQRQEALEQGDIWRAELLDREPQKPMGLLGRVQDAYVRLRDNIHHYAAIDQRGRMLQEFDRMHERDPVTLKQAILRIQDWTEEVIERFNRTRSDQDRVPVVRYER